MAKRKKQIERIRRFTTPLRVEPGTSVRLPKGFNPRFRAGLRKKDAKDLLSRGVEMLADYQDAAGGAEHVRRCWWCCRRSTPPARTARSST